MIVAVVLGGTSVTGGRGTLLRLDPGRVARRRAGRRTAGRRIGFLDPGTCAVQVRQSAFRAAGTLLVIGVWLNTRRRPVGERKPAGSGSFRSVVADSAAGVRYRYDEFDRIFDYRHDCRSRLRKNRPVLTTFGRLANSSGLLCSLLMLPLLRRLPGDAARRAPARGQARRQAVPRTRSLSRHAAQADEHRLFPRLPGGGAKGGGRARRAS